MTTATAHSSTAVIDVAADNALAARMIHPRADVIAALRKALEKGLEIKALKLRYQEDLDEARALKLRWSQATHDLLNTLFDNSSVADYCNDWVGKIFPEFAAVGNFIEQFYEEMEHRVGKLRSVLRRIEQIADVAPAPLAAPTPTRHSALAAAAPTAVAAAPVARGARAVAPPTSPQPSAAAAPAIVTHSMEPVRVPSVVLMGAAASDATHGAVATWLKQLHLTPLAAPDASEADPISDAAIFIMPPQPLDEQGIRKALFQLGIAIGRLGHGRVCVLHPTGGKPLAEVGLAHIAVDIGGGWQLQLARQLRQAGFDIDLNRLCS